MGPCYGLTSTSWVVVEAYSSLLNVDTSLELASFAVVAETALALIWSELVGE